MSHTPHGHDSVLDEDFDDIERYREPLKLCPPPMRLATDQYRCTLCNRVWDTHEERPDCEYSQ